MKMSYQEIMRFEIMPTQDLDCTPSSETTEASYCHVKVGFFMEECEVFEIKHGSFYVT